MALTARPAFVLRRLPAAAVVGRTRRMPSCTLRTCGSRRMHCTLHGFCRPPPFCMPPALVRPPAAVGGGAPHPRGAASRRAAHKSFMWFHDHSYLALCTACETGARPHSFCTIIPYVCNSCHSTHARSLPIRVCAYYYSSLANNCQRERHAHPLPAARRPAADQQSSTCSGPAPGSAPCQRCCCHLSPRGPPASAAHARATQPFWPAAPQAISIIVLPSVWIISEAAPPNG